MTSKIILRNSRYTLEIDPHGAAIMRFYDTATKEDFIYGYANEAEKTGGMGDVLFPWPGRVENKQYIFKGKKYHLEGVSENAGNALHGFAKDQTFAVVSAGPAQVELEYIFKKEKFAPLGYPFEAKLNIRYSLGHNGFSCQSKVENIGKDYLPFGLGFHPYFYLNAKSIDELKLQIPAKKMIEFDNNLKPTGKFIEIEKSHLDFSQNKKINQSEIDNCFYDLEYSDRKAQTVLTRQDGRRITIYQDENMPYLQIYSADTIGKKHFRRALAIEPQTCCGYSLNIPELGLIVLKQRQKFKCLWGVEVSA